MKFVKKNETTHRDILLFLPADCHYKVDIRANTVHIIDSEPSTIFLIQLKSSQRFLVAIAHVEKLFTETRKEMDGIFWGKL